MAAAVSRLAAQQFQRGAREDLEGHHGGRGIARQSEEELAARAAEDQRLSGLNSTRSKKNSAPSSASTRSTMSYLPAETPPESSSRSELEPALDQLARVRPNRVARDGQHARRRRRRASPARPANRRSNCESENSPAFRRARRFRRRWPESPPRLAEDLDAAEAERGQHRDPGVVEALAGAEHDLSRRGFAALRIDELLRRTRIGIDRCARRRRSTCSTMTTASAPSGTGAPVMISTAWRGPTCL